MSEKEVQVVDIKDIAFPEITLPELTQSIKQIAETLPEHKEMLKVIEAGLPEVQRASSLFYKTQSQFMDNMMTVSANTPIRNLRQILAEMTRTRDAIKEASFNLKKKEIEMRMKKRDLEKEKDELKAEMLMVEIMEIQSQANTTKDYMSGAIRRLANYTEQYNSIMEKYRLEGFNEADFEQEEERYHIMKAFEQALCAARSRGGIVDEGNMIYFTQIGINGAGAQREISEYLRAENLLLQGLDLDGKPLVDANGNPVGPAEPTYKMYLMFLERMADKYQGSADNYAQVKGMTTVSATALIKEGDRRLFLKSPEKD